MEARPNHESLGPSPSSVSSRAQVGATRAAHLHHQPANGKAKGRAMVLRRHRARRLLLRSGDDDAPTAGRVAESCHVLPWRTKHGAAEGLSRLFWGDFSARLSDRQTPITAKNPYQRGAQRAQGKPSVLAFLLASDRRAYPIIGSCRLGGMTLGFSDASNEPCCSFRPRLMVDSDPEARTVALRNFPSIPFFVAGLGFAGRKSSDVPKSQREFVSPTRLCVSTKLYMQDRRRRPL